MDSPTAISLSHALYTHSGQIQLMLSVHAASSSQVTLTCISTGGPATTVTWTRDSTTTVTEGTETVLDDPETAQYTHTLNVTTGGKYTCTVANVAFSASESITVQGLLQTKIDSRLLASVFCQEPHLPVM